MMKTNTLLLLFNKVNISKYLIVLNHIGKPS